MPGWRVRARRGIGRAKPKNRAARAHFRSAWPHGFVEDTRGGRGEVVDVVGACHSAEAGGDT